jgi:GAF domain-containing protein
MTTVRAHRLAKVFVEVADTFVGTFDALEFQQMLVSRTAELLEAPAVGLLLADHRGGLRFVAASDEDVGLIELLQAQTWQGPCLDAFRTAEPVFANDLPTAADRWPLFAPRAVALGFRAVHAFPLRLRLGREVVGALNVFGHEREPGFDDADRQIVQALADVAAIALLQERTVHRTEVLAAQLQGAFDTRLVIEQAKGVLAHAHSIGVDEAFALLREYARSHNRKLSDVARAVVTDLARLPELAECRPDEG